MLRSVQVLRRLMVRNKDVGVFCNVAAATLSSPANFAQCLDFLESSRAVASSLIFEFKQAAFRGFGAVEREHLAALAQRGYRFSIDHVTDLRMERIPERPKVASHEAHAAFELAHRPEPTCASWRRGFLDETAVFVGE